MDGIVNAFATVTSFVARISSWIDENIIDGIVTQTASTADRAGGLLSKVQTGKVQTYLALIVFSFIIPVFNYAKSSNGNLPLWNFTFLALVF